jgi:hypothetical protein
MAAFNFDESDLAANRQKRQSPRQRRDLLNIMLRGWTIFGSIGLGAHIIISFAFASSLTQALLLLLFFIGVPCLMLTILMVFQLGVGSIEGPAELSPPDIAYMGFILRIRRMKFHITPEAFQTLQNAHLSNLTVYYRGIGNTGGEILSFEETPPDTE